MENRYLHRAKRQDGSGWVTGCYVYAFAPDPGCPVVGVHMEHHCIIEENGSIKIIDPSTVCQCIGYEGIFERDIFLHDDDLYVIRWCDADLSWWAEAVFSSESEPLGEFRPEDIDVIGNEIDNPELLEVDA